MARRTWCIVGSRAWWSCTGVGMFGLAIGAATGCSSELDEHAYPPPSTSDGGVDGDAPDDAADGQACAPKTCVQLGAECGSALDGCDGIVECGECSAGLNCGGGGLNKCGTSGCTPNTCTQLAASCGLVSDGCGKTLSCGTCAPPNTCAGGGVPYQCGCAPATCSGLLAECGQVLDGCGGLVDCGGCPAGKYCGGGAANKCSDIPCDPDTCQSIGAQCGAHPDGCMGVLNCGSCAAPKTCGGGGDPKACGCTPTSCAAELAQCGPLSDGCGITLDCGTCPYGSCQNNTCVCTPTTCSAQGADCGSIQDGCGATLDCGTCSAPKQCGASGVPNLCACTPTLCPPFYTNSFEGGTDFPAEWIVWHNCAVDSNWSVEVSPYPAPSGGVSNLRFHTTQFLSPCDWPGAYAQSPSLSAEPGRTYRVESWSRHGGSVAGATLLFFNAANDNIGQTQVLWPSDIWEYQANPPTSATAPPNTTHLQVRILLTSPEAYLDFDLLAVYLEP